MTAPEKLTVTGPADILGFIPHSLGYWPSASLVAMTMQGTQLGATLRLDLPVPAAGPTPQQYLHAVRGYLDADDGADGTLLAVFTSDSHLAAGAFDGLLSGLAQVLEEAGMPVRDAWYVGEDYWRDAYCRDPGCCPLPGRSVHEIRDSALNAEMVYRGSSVGPAPERRRGTVRPVPGLHRAAVLEAEDEWIRQLEPRRRSIVQFRLVLDIWEELLAVPAGHPWIPDVDRDAFLGASLLIPHWRDALLVLSAAGRGAAEAGAEQFRMFDGGGQPAVCPPSLLPGAQHLVAAQGELAAPDVTARAVTAPDEPGNGAAPPAYGAVLMGLEPAVPDWARMDALDRILAELAAPGGASAAAALTLRGWIAWCRGRGSYAAGHLAEALATEPGYRLAELILELVGRGTLCGWAARKAAAWQKFGPAQ